VPLEQQPQGVKDILLVIGDENSRCMPSRSLEIPSAAVVMVGCPCVLHVLSVPHGHTEAACLPVTPARNGFRVNGLYRIEEQRCASVWPLAGTTVPNSHSERWPGLALKGKAPLGGSLPSPDLQLDGCSDFLP